jgi:hypothetical protein
MGRPLKRDVRGTNVLGLSNLGNIGITVSGYFGGGLSTAYSIIKQRGASSFVVAKKETFTADTTNGGFTLTNMSDQVEGNVGDELGGIGIATDARVASIDSATQVTMTIAATATNTGTTVTHFGAYQVGKLVNTTPNAEGEILMQGSTTGLLDQNLVPIAKITRKVAHGFPSSPVLSGGFNRGEDSNAATNHDATRYTWYLENDSSADIIVLTAI